MTGAQEESALADQVVRAGRGEAERPVEPVQAEGGGHAGRGQVFAGAQGGQGAGRGGAGVYEAGGENKGGVPQLSGGGASVQGCVCHLRGYQ